MLPWGLPCASLPSQALGTPCWDFYLHAVCSWMNSGRRAIIAGLNLSSSSAWIRVCFLQRFL